ncbi:MAG: transcriptional repressor LexA [Peptococcaceae bacterium]|jgi:repressor LexA|nr:transcriptional repressor LexA [Peptococcaceae bacterium]
MALPEESKRKKDKPLTPRQQSILHFIINEVETRGYPPAVREIGREVGLSSSSTVHAHLTTLEKRGYIQRDPTKPRAIMILRNPDGTPFNFGVEVPAAASEHDEIVDLPVLGNVAAGEPIFADENVEDKISFSMRFVRNEGAFMLRIRGESMIKAGIMDGDYIIVAPQQTAQNGDIVVALIGDEATCKTFYYEKNVVRLQPENDEMEPIYVENPMIIGKVIGVYRDLH